MEFDEETWETFGIVSGISMLMFVLALWNSGDLRSLYAEGIGSFILALVITSIIAIGLGGGIYLVWKWVWEETRHRASVRRVDNSLHDICPWWKLEWAKINGLFTSGFKTLEELEMLIAHKIRIADKIRMDLDKINETVIMEMRFSGEHQSELGRKGRQRMDRIFQWIGEQTPEEAKAKLISLGRIVKDTKRIIGKIRKTESDNPFEQAKGSWLSNIDDMMIRHNIPLAEHQNLLWYNGKISGLLVNRLFMTDEEIEYICNHLYGGESAETAAELKKETGIINFYEQDNRLRHDKIMERMGNVTLSDETRNKLGEMIKETRDLNQAIVGPRGLFTNLQHEQVRIFELQKKIIEIVGEGGILERLDASRDKPPDELRTAIAEAKRLAGQVKAIVSNIKKYNFLFKGKRGEQVRKRVWKNLAKTAEEEYKREVAINKEHLRVLRKFFITPVKYPLQLEKERTKDEEEDEEEEKKLLKSEKIKRVGEKGVEIIFEDNLVFTIIFPFKKRYGTSFQPGNKGAGMCDLFFGAKTSDDFEYTQGAEETLENFVDTFDGLSPIEKKKYTNTLVELFKNRIGVLMRFVEEENDGVEKRFILKEEKKKEDLEKVGKKVKTISDLLAELNKRADEDKLRPELNAVMKLLLRREERVDFEGETAVEKARTILGAVNLNQLSFWIARNFPIEREQYQDLFKDLQRIEFKIRGGETFAAQDELKDLNTAVFKAAKMTEKEGFLFLKSPYFRTQRGLFRHLEPRKEFEE
ncbi:hypothetical protein ACFL0W_03820 [Nanoarchaeota archaeon]